MRKEILFYLPIFILTSCAQNRPNSTRPIEPATEISIYTKKDQYEDYKNAGGSLSFFEWQVTVLGEDPNGYQRYGTYVVYFLDGDDNIITHSVVEPGMPAIYDGGKPTKSDLNNNGTITKFIFSKWDNDFDNIHSNMVVHALFEEDSNKYFDVKFEDYDGTLISESAVIAGRIPVEPDNPSRDRKINGHQITDFEFAGWDREIQPIYSPTVFVALYNQINWEGYKVTWKAPDGAILKTDLYKKGSSPIYENNETYIPFYYDSEYNYVFASWDRSITNLSSDEVIKEIAIKIPLLQNGDTGLNGDEIKDEKLVSVLTSIAKSYGAEYGSELIFSYKSNRYKWHANGSITSRPPMRWHLLDKCSDKILVTSEKPYCLYDFDLSKDIKNGNLDYESLNSYLNESVLGGELMGICFGDDSKVLETILDNSLESRMLNESDTVEDDSYGRLFLLSAEEYSRYKERMIMLGSTKQFMTRSYSKYGRSYRVVGIDWELKDDSFSDYFYPCLWFSLD